MTWHLTPDDEQKAAIEAKAIAQLENESDRSVAIVAGALVERRLTELIISRFHQNKKLQDELFRVSGPLGNFGTKIDLAFLMGLVGKEGHRELDTLKNIRNRFAHYIEVTDFESQQIANWCSNLKIFERYYTADTGHFDTLEKIEKWKKKNPPGPAGFITGSKDFDKRKKISKYRYLYTAAVFTGFFGMERNYLDPPQVAPDL
jgi:DNA-binding MltR family transcriptional regulator